MTLEAGLHPIIPITPITRITVQTLPSTNARAIISLCTTISALPTFRPWAPSPKTGVPFVAKRPRPAFIRAPKAPKTAPRCPTLHIQNRAKWNSLKRFFGVSPGPAPRLTRPKACATNRPAAQPGRAAGTARGMEA